jgi:hypothetical protein
MYWDLLWAILAWIGAGISIICGIRAWRVALQARKLGRYTDANLDQTQELLDEIKRRTEGLENLPLDLKCVIARIEQAYGDASACDFLLERMFTCDRPRLQRYVDRLTAPSAYFDRYMQQSTVDSKESGNANVDLPGV